MTISSPSKTSCSKRKWTQLKFSAHRLQNKKLNKRDAGQARSQQKRKGGGWGGGGARQEKRLTRTEHAFWRTTHTHTHTHTHKMIPFSQQRPPPPFTLIPHPLPYFLPSPNLSKTTRPLTNFPPSFLTANKLAPLSLSLCRDPWTPELLGPGHPASRQTFPQERGGQASDTSQGQR